MSAIIAPPEAQTAIETAPVLSAEIFIIPAEEGQYIVYAPLRRAAFIANATVVNFLADLQAGVYDPYVDPDGSLVKFLRQLEILDAGEETLPITTFAGDPEPTSVTLFLTTACNLRCTYCYASAGDTPTRFMKLEVAQRGINFVAANALKRGAPSFEVGYHGGGEPSLAWRTMVGSLEYAREKGKEMGLEVRSYAATNGVLPNERIDWIIANLSGVSMSFDGLPAVHDTHRLTVLGEGSSDRVMHTIHRFDEARFDYGLRLTATADQISTLPDSVAFICSHFQTQHIMVEPSYQLGRWKDAASAETEAFIAAFREAQARAHRHGREIRYSASRLGTLTNHFCGVSQDSFCLSPDGNVSGCYEAFSEDNRWSDTFFYGKPDERNGGYIFNLPVLNNLRHLGVQHKEYCQGCFAKWSCAGDCHHKALEVNDGAEFTGSERCHITRELTKDLILERIEMSGGMFWHEPPPEIAESLRQVGMAKQGF